MFSELSESSLAKGKLRKLVKDAPMVSGIISMCEIIVDGRIVYGG